eukprot:jgi/Mesvir1/26110/Mv06827-RA.1
MSSTASLLACCPTDVSSRVSLERCSFLAGSPAVGAAGSGSARHFPVRIRSSRWSLAPHRKLKTVTMASDGTTDWKPNYKVPPPAHPTYDIRNIIGLALAEDLGADGVKDGMSAGDVTCVATIPEQIRAEATFLAKEDGILAGVAVVDMVFRTVDPALTVEWTLGDGDALRRGVKFGTVRGSARSILVAERVALNFMQRMSGIATATHAMAERAKPARILETRKTMPGMRLLDKWAVLIGGGQNHRMGLFDMVMVKDNHIAVSGGITAAAENARRHLAANNLRGMDVEVETRTLEEVAEAVRVVDQQKAAGVEVGKITRIMLDNMVVKNKACAGGVDTSLLETAVKMIAGRVETEASGNVTLETVHAIGRTGVTYISSGALTHSVMALDISLNVDVQLADAVNQRQMQGM